MRLIATQSNAIRLHNKERQLWQRGQQDEARCETNERLNSRQSVQSGHRWALIIDVVRDGLLRDHYARAGANDNSGPCGEASSL